MADTGVTDILTRFVAGFGTGDLPVPVRRECVRAFVNAVGCTVGGGQHQLVESAYGALAACSGAPAASLLGRGAKADILLAAEINGLAGAAYSFDDAYSAALLHPTGPVAMAALALAERNGASGARFLDALALGMETACRLARMLTAPPARCEIAWSMTGLACGAGAAMAAGKLLDLDPARLNWALGIAVSQASGTRVTHGSMSASLIFGHAARSGLQAALLAKHGFTSTEGSIEKRFGFASVFAQDANPWTLVEELGERYELLSNTYKPYPCALVIHPSLDGVLQLKRTGGFSSDAIDRIALRVSPNTITLSSRPHPRNEMEAKLSLHHWVAAAAVTGKVRIREGAQDVVADPEVGRIRGLIDLTSDAAITDDAAEVTITFTDGRTLHQAVGPCIGSLGRPMSDGELAEKFLGQAEAAIGRERSERLLDQCWQVETLADIGVLANAAC